MLAPRRERVPAAVLGRSAPVLAHVRARAIPGRCPYVLYSVLTDASRQDFYYGDESNDLAFDDGTPDDHMPPARQVRTVLFERSHLRRVLTLTSLNARTAGVVRVRTILTRKRRRGMRRRRRVVAIIVDYLLTCVQRTKHAEVLEISSEDEAVRFSRLLQPTRLLFSAKAEASSALRQRQDRPAPQMRWTRRQQDPCSQGASVQVPQTHPSRKYPGSAVSTRADKYAPF